MTPKEPIAAIHEINWTVVIVQAVVQVIVLGSLLVGYIITNERWKGGIDANMVNFNIVNKTQLETNQRLEVAISKLSDSVGILSNNQAKVLTLLEYHMAEDRSKFGTLETKVKR